MRTIALGLGLLAGACVMPPRPAERAGEAAREFNLAARFGRMDRAAELTATSWRGKFEKSHREWGRDVRVYDVELAGFVMPERDRANVEVDYSWARVDEGILRSTRVAQVWKDSGQGFRIVGEHRVAGDLGLLGELVSASAPGANQEPNAPQATERRDVQFATKVIR